MSNNFTHGSESIITFVTEILGYIVGIASVTCSTILIFIAVRNSPREMGTYKWYIIFNATSCAGFDLLFGLLHPEPVFPPVMFMTGGLMKYWMIPSYILCFIFYAALAFLSGILYSMILLFLYRYLQTVNSRFLKVVSRGSSSVLLCSAVYCILTVPAFIATGNVVTSESKLREFLRVNQPMIYSIAHNRSIIGFENSKDTWLYFAYCWATINLLLYLAIITYCVYGCYASMQLGKSAFSSKTLMLYRSLVNALMIDLAICVVMVILPIGLCGICIYSQFEWASTATLLAMSFASWYPCVSHIIWMWFITPYRRALVRLFKGRGKTAQDKNTNFLQLSEISKQTKL